MIMEGYPSLEFETKPFAEGRFRRAFRAKWTYPPSKAGNRAVVKEMKSTFMWEPSSWDTILKNYATAEGLATRFNNRLRFSNCRVSFAEVVTGIVTEQPIPNGTPKLNEYVVVEEYLPGIYTKWCSNGGYILIFLTIFLTIKTVNQIQVTVTNENNSCGASAKRGESHRQLRFSGDQVHWG